MSGGSRENFTEMGTLGVEEEYFVVDEEGYPASGTDDLVYDASAPEPITDDVDHELFKFVVETRTPVLDGPRDAEGAVREMRSAMVEHAAEHGFNVAAAGLHPAAVWRLLDHVEKPRYKAQLERIQYPQHRNTTAGLHLHVGVDDAEKAVWISNEIRWYLPLILALSVNSPFWNGFDTGLASARAKIFEGLPNTGIPTAFGSYDEFEHFESTMIQTDSIGDRGELWFDVRPHSEHGTVEIRVPDSQDRTGHVDGLAEYVHALVLDLAERFDDGESGTRFRRELLDENKWRALRYGHEASFIDFQRDDVVSLPEAVDREAERLGVSGIRDLLDAESGAARQRRILEEQGHEALRRELLLDERV
ncbi:MAG: glutamate--cysteine ligase [Halodesulfurarchaeum sp.]